VDDRHVRPDRRHRGEPLAGERAVDELHVRVVLRQVAAQIAAQQAERQPRGAGGVGRRHAGVRVLLELERRRPALLDGVAQAVQRPDARVAAPGEHQLPRGAGPDQLVVDDIRRHPDEGEVLVSLPDDLVPRRERNEVGESLERHHVAITEKLANCFGKLNYLSQNLLIVHDLRL
jgi:hypothetical protein